MWDNEGNEESGFVVVDGWIGDYVYVWGKDCECGVDGLVGCEKKE